MNNKARDNILNLMGNVKYNCLGKEEEQILDQILKRYTEKGGLILDPAVGSGRLLMWAHKNERNFCGFLGTTSRSKIKRELKKEEFLIPNEVFNAQLHNPKKFEIVIGNPPYIQNPCSVFYEASPKGIKWLSENKVLFFKQRPREIEIFFKILKSFPNTTIIISTTSQSPFHPETNFNDLTYFFRLSKEMKVHKFHVYSKIKRPFDFDILVDFLRGFEPVLKGKRRKKSPPEIANQAKCAEFLEFFGAIGEYKVVKRKKGLIVRYDIQVNNTKKIIIEIKNYPYWSKQKVADQLKNYLIAGENAIILLICNYTKKISNSEMEPDWRNYMYNKVPGLKRIKFNVVCVSPEYLQSRMKKIRIKDNKADNVSIKYNSPCRT